MLNNRTVSFAFLALLAVLSLIGCSVAENVNLGGKAPEPVISNTPPPAAPVVVKEPVFIYSYSNKGIPIESGRIVSVNWDGSVTLETKQSGETIRFNIDPRGWLLVKPPSPIKLEEPVKAEIVPLK